MPCRSDGGEVSGLAHLAIAAGRGRSFSCAAGPDDGRWTSVHEFTHTVYGNLAVSLGLPLSAVHA